jgi:hypothetical protein
MAVREQGARAHRRWFAGFRAQDGIWLRAALHALHALCVLAVLGAALPGWVARAEEEAEEDTPAEARAGAAVPPLVINELHYNHDVESQLVEFVELHNTARVALDLSGWALDGGIDYVFPPRTSIAPEGYLVVAENVAQVKAKWNVASVVGPYNRRLAGEGDNVELRDPQGNLADLVEYQLGFPWPTVGDAPGNSIQLINPEYDNDRAGNWRSAAPTPGRRNGVLTSNTPPLIETVSHAPRNPKSGEAVVVTVHIDDPDGIQSLRLLYQVVEPGAYIGVNDGAYWSNWTAVDMQFAGDQGYQATLPGSLQRHRRLVRYRVQASDKLGNRVDAPFADDPQPNFAYFVYDGIPTWTGSIRGDGSNRTTYDFNAMRPLAVYQVLAKEADVADAMFMPPSGMAAGYMGNDELWRGTLVYDGVVYDHISFRARGGRDRYATGKTNWKITFNRGHYLQAHNNYGQPFRTRWDSLNLNAIIQQVHRGWRGEQGLFESMTYRLFNLAGVPGPYTHYAHLRVIDNASEQGGSQYEGDFWGLYLAIEQPDGKLLDEHGLPDGNLYKMENWTGELNHQGKGMPSDLSDLNAFMYAYTNTNPDNAWWHANFDLEGYYRYRSVTEFVRHFDVNEGKNYLYFHNPETGKWSIHPWDVDLTWARNMPGDGNEPFRDRVLLRGEFQIEYQNHMRELRDLLFNADQMFPLLDEHAGWVDTPADGPAMVDADRAMWDYNPIYDTRYVVWGRTLPGEFYAEGDPESFRGMVNRMKEWVADRAVSIDTYILTDTSYPATPNAVYRGPSGYPADALRFETGGFSDPQGNHTFGALEWRIAEINYPGAPGYDAQRPPRYEIQTTWESGALDWYMGTLTPPAGVIQPGRGYRVRVRVRDTSGRWSHWSPPVQFVAGAPVNPPTTNLKVSEIMYNPLSETHYSSEDLEFIELFNLGKDALDLSNVQLTDGIDYIFPPGTGLPGGAHIVVARNVEAFLARYNFKPFGEYDRGLSNSGDTVTVLDPFGRTLFTVTYDDSSPWAESADGDGPSLVLSPLSSNPANPASWRASNAIHGSPGGYDPAPLLINEVLTAPGPGQDVVVELYNPTSQPANAGLWYLSDDPGDPRKARIPQGVTVPANGYINIGGDVLRQAGEDGPLQLAQTGRQTLYLFSANGARMTGYSHGVAFGIAEAGVTVGRHVDSRGLEQFVAQAQPTLGAANAGPRVGPVVISSIGYGGAGSIQYVELANIGSQAVKLYDESEPDPAAATWQLSGAFFRFPAGAQLQPGERLVVAASAAEEFCQNGLGNGRQVFGPLTRPLDAEGQEVALWRPIRRSPDNTLDYVQVDRVSYSVAGGWPMTGAALARSNPGAFGNDPANWAAAPPPAAADGAPGQLCSLRAATGATGSAVTVAWSLVPAPEMAAFRVWRSTGLNKENLVEIGQVSAQASMTAPASPAAGSAYSTLYSVVDNTAVPGATYVYWLESVSAGNAVAQLGFTTPQAAHEHTFLPLLGSR